MIRHLALAGTLLAPALSAQFQYETDHGLIRPSDRPATDAAAGFALAEGTSTVSANIGMLVQPAALALDVPAQSNGLPNQIAQVILYWEGNHSSDTNADDTLLVSNPALGLFDVPVQGAPLAPTYLQHHDRSIYELNYTTSFRADITGLGLVQLGANSLSFDGFDSLYAHGAGILVILDNGEEGRDLLLVEGNDSSHFHWDEDYHPSRGDASATVTFEASPEARQGSFTLFVGNVRANRYVHPNAITVSVENQPEIFYWDELYLRNGPSDKEFGVVTIDVDVPAGATSLTVRLVGDIDPTNSRHVGKHAAALTWVSMLVDLPAAPAVSEGCRAGFWFRNPQAWPQGFDPSWWCGTRIGDAFDVRNYRVRRMTMRQALTRPFCFWRNPVGRMTRQATAAMLNAAHPGISYPADVATVRLIYQTALASQDRNMIRQTTRQLREWNELGCQNIPAAAPGSGQQSRGCRSPWRFWRR